MKVLAGIFYAASIVAFMAMVLSVKRKSQTDGSPARDAYWLLVAAWALLLVASLLMTVTL